MSNKLNKQRDQERRLLETKLLGICQQAARKVLGAGYRQHGDDAAGEAMLYALKAVQAGASPATVAWYARNGASNYLRQLGGRSQNGAVTGYRLVVNSPESLYVTGADGNEYERPDLGATEEQYANIEMTDWMQDALTLLTLREAAALQCFMRGLSITSMAAELGLSWTRCHQLRHQLFGKLRRAMQSGRL